MKAGELIAERYRLTRKLGAGGMGEVWGAENIGTDRPCAIKFLHSHVAQSSEGRIRFLREAKASARINHVNVVDVYDVGETPDGGLYITLELLDGVALSEAMKQNPPLPITDFLVVLADAAKALAAAHIVGIVHRDVKPGNIFLHREKGQEVAHGKVLDFGISKFMEDEATATGSMLGSPHYMAPEQVQHSRSVDGRADIWAMGVILFRGLTGQWPHMGEGYHQIILAVANEAPQQIDAVAPQLPESLKRIVRHCLLPHQERLADANVLAGWLEEAASEPAVQPLKTQTAGDVVTASTGIKVRTPTLGRSTAPTNVTPPVVPARPRSRFPTIGLLLAGLLVSAGAFLMFFGDDFLSGAGLSAGSAPVDVPAAQPTSTTARSAPSVDPTTAPSLPGSSLAAATAEPTTSAEPTAPPPPTVVMTPPPSFPQASPPPPPPEPPSAPPPSDPALPGEDLGSGL